MRSKNKIDESTKNFGQGLIHIYAAMWSLGQKGQERNRGLKPKVINQAKEILNG